MKRDWTKINWTKTNEEIAAETNYSVSTINNYRYKHGFTAATKVGGAHKPFQLNALRKMKLPGLIVTVGKERLSLDRLRKTDGESKVNVSPGDFMEAWQRKGMEIIYPRDEVIVK